MRTCQNCKFGDPAADQTGARFYHCRLLPPRPLVVSGKEGQEVIWVVPPMASKGWCYQFRLAFFRWIGNFTRRGT